MVTQEIFGGGVNTKTIANDAGEHKQGKASAIRNWFLKKFGYPPPIAMQHDLQRFKLLPSPPEEKMVMIRIRRKLGGM